MNLLDVRGKYKGHIYLTGNAPGYPPKGLTFGMNRCAFAPDIYFCADPFVLDNYHAEVGENMALSQLYFAPIPTRDKKNGVEISVKTTDQGDDLTKGLYGFGTSMMPCLQLCWWLGFTEVTVTHMNFYTSQQYHSYPMSDDSMSSISKEEMSGRRKTQIRAHAWMMDYADKKGIELRYM